MTLIILLIKSFNLLETDPFASYHRSIYFTSYILQKV